MATDESPLRRRVVNPFKLDGRSFCRVGCVLWVSHSFPASVPALMMILQGNFLSPLPNHSECSNPFVKPLLEICVSDVCCAPWIGVLDRDQPPL